MLTQESVTPLKMQFRAATEEALKNVFPKRFDLGWLGELRGVITELSDEGKPKTFGKPKKIIDAFSGSYPEPYATKAEDFASKSLRLQKLNLIETEQSIEKITRSLRCYNYQVPIINLPRELEGTTILHLSDIHFAAHRSRTLIDLGHIANFLDNKQIRPDFCVLTGDIITDHPHELHENALRMLNRVARNSQRLAVLGNHDYYGANPEYVNQALLSIGYQMLTNERITVSINGKPIVFHGVDDLLEGKTKIPIINNGEHDKTHILLTHNLDAVNRDFPKSFDLVLSGHTHGGEVFGGYQIMKATGYAADINKQKVGWKNLTDRTLSYVHPGLARHWMQLGAMKPGVAVLKLKGISP